MDCDVKLTMEVRSDTVGLYIHSHSISGIWTLTQMATIKMHHSRQLSDLRNKK